MVLIKFKKDFYLIFLIHKQESFSDPQDDLIDRIVEPTLAEQGLILT